MPKKVLFLPQTSELAPAAGFRIYQYLPYLKEQGMDFDVLPAIDSNKHKAVFGDEKTLIKKTYNYTKALFFRTANIQKFLKYDCIFFQKETFPYMYPVAEKLLTKKHNNVVFDFDDAVFLKYKHTHFFKKLLPSFRTVIAGNSYLYDYARKFNKNTTIIPTTIDTDLYKPENKVHTDTINIGWSGSLTTNPYLNLIKEPLRKLFAKYDNLRLIIISNSKKGIELELPSDRIEFIPWNYESTVSDLKKINIGLMPLPKNRWSEGKCALKLLQYMSLGIPSICSPTDANCEAVIDGKNGFIAADTEQWISKIEELIADNNAYSHIAEAARKTVASKYSTTKWLPEIIKIINA